MWQYGATQALCRGSCATEVGVMMCADFWALAEAYPNPARVDSAGWPINPADAPIRDCVWCAEPIKCE